MLLSMSKKKKKKTQKVKIREQTVLGENLQGLISLLFVSDFVTHGL